MTRGIKKKRLGYIHSKGILTEENGKINNKTKIPKEMYFWDGFLCLSAFPAEWLLLNWGLPLLTTSP